MIGVNYQVQKGFPTPPADLPILAIVPDWMQDVTAFAGMNVQMWRFMGSVDQVIALTPTGGAACWWNELPHGDRSYLIPQITKVRQQRPDIRVHYGAEHQGGSVAGAVAGLCDVVDVHNAIWESPPTQSWTTELELTPGAPEWDQVVPWCLRSRMPVFVWGADAERADVNDHPDLIAALARLNTNAASSSGAATGVSIVAATDPEVTQVLDQNSHIGQALYDLARAYADAQGLTADQQALIQDAKAHINALDPGRFSFS